ncbi:MAG: T9SS type A sorting domain-containing protein [Flavobacteriales bacterium]|nr:T9SS type A sorting domain-containing protein [Flavobacteriales bacterium]MEB2341735.1 T9SS type A sorting domain-containing protein [Flavobacteriia bacterium]
MDHVHFDIHLARATMALGLVCCIASSAQAQFSGGPGQGYASAEATPSISATPDLDLIHCPCTVTPNPGDGVFTLIWLRTASGDRYTVTNPIGQTVLDGKLKGEKQVIDLSKQPAGVYMLSLFSGIGTYVQRIVKQ